MEDLRTSLTTMCEDLHDILDIKIPQPSLLLQINIKIQEIQNIVDKYREDLIQDNCEINEKEQDKYEQYVQRQSILKKIYPLMLYCLVSNSNLE